MRGERGWNFWARAASVEARRRDQARVDLWFPMRQRDGEGEGAAGVV
jgi:hypothetical protein